jgi:hypothetical protein
VRSSSARRRASSKDAQDDAAIVAALSAFSGHLETDQTMRRDALLQRGRGERTQRVTGLSYDVCFKLKVSFLPLLSKSSRTAVALQVVELRALQVFAHHRLKFFDAYYKRRESFVTLVKEIGSFLITYN